MRRLYLSGIFFTIATTAMSNGSIACSIQIPDISENESSVEEEYFTDYSIAEEKNSGNVIEDNQSKLEENFSMFREYYFLYVYFKKWKIDGFKNVAVTSLDYYLKSLRHAHSHNSYIFSAENRRYAMAAIDEISCRAVDNKSIADLKELLKLIETLHATPEYRPGWKRGSRKKQRRRKMCEFQSVRKREKIEIRINRKVMRLSTMNHNLNSMILPF